MDDQRPREGGSANTPPFPPIHPQEPASPAHSRREDLASPSGPVGDSPTPPVAGDSTPDIASGSRPAAADLSSDPFPRPNGEFRTDDLEDRAERTHGPGDEIRRRARRGVARGFDRLAERLEETAGRLGSIAETQLPSALAAGRAGEVAHSAVSLLEDAADYLRASDLESVRTDLERRVRQRPVQSLLIAAAAGWVLGKIMR